MKYQSAVSPERMQTARQSNAIRAEKMGLLA
jgi:hypothetical protein